MKLLSVLVCSVFLVGCSSMPNDGQSASTSPVCGGGSCAAFDSMSAAASRSVSATPDTKQLPTTQTLSPVDTPEADPATPIPAKLCGAPPNPYGYNFCHRGTAITAPEADVCTYFDCIANFHNGHGYMVECDDLTYSMSGGRPGACSYHHGEKQEVFSGP